MEAVDFVVADPASWVRDCERSYPKVYRGLVAMGATESDAADAVQDAFEQGLRTSRAPAKPEGWLFVVALRSWRRHRWRSRLFHPLSAATGRHRIDSHDERIDLIAALGQLTERQRAIVVARYALGLSQHEAAESVGVSAGTIAATCHQAITRLRRTLEGLE
jgi:RNA polymerase sigma factor (sigma-70 family)